MPKANVNGIDIYYEVHGSGDPLVLIGGLGYDIWQWHKMIPLLAEEFQVVIFDNRGVGRSDSPPGPYTADMLAEDTAGLITYLGHEEAAVMGFSMGGFVAQALAINRPELVGHLILAATNFGGPNHIGMTPERLAIMTDMTMDPVERTRWGIRESTAPGFVESNPGFVEEWIKYSLNRPVGFFQGYQAQLAIGTGLIAASYEESFQPKLKKLNVPTLILFGEHDVIVPVANAQLLAQEIPDSRVKLLPDSAHFFPFDSPEFAVGAIISFLRDQPLKPLS